MTVQFPRGREGGPEHIRQAAHMGPLLVTLGGSKWVLTGISSKSGQRSAYLVGHANTPNTIKGLEQTYCPSLDHQIRIR